MLLLRAAASRVDNRPASRSLADRQTNKLHPIISQPDPVPRRQSTQRRVPRDLPKPTHHGEVYATIITRYFTKKQRMPAILLYPEKERVSVPDLKRQRTQRARQP